MKTRFRLVFMAVVLLASVPVSSQNTSKTIALAERSNIPTEEISKSLRKECPQVSIMQDTTKSDYTVEAVRKTDSQRCSRLQSQPFRPRPDNFQKLRTKSRSLGQVCVPCHNGQRESFDRRRG
jgi:CO dehydrogenase/acetyl-CoA synthase alpha subunit